MTVCRFVIPLPPPPPWRPVPAMVGGQARLLTPKPSREWRAAAVPFVVAARPKDRYTDAVLVDLLVVCPRPKRLQRRKDPGGLLWAVTKPDVDNIAKTVLDTMTAAGWWLDDDQVAGLSVHRFYAESDRAARVEVTVRPALDDVDRFGRIYGVTRRIFRAQLNRERVKRAEQWLRKVALGFLP